MDHKKDNQENFNKWSHIVAKAWMDPKFKKELLAHPEKVLKEHGIDMHGKKVRIMENTGHETYFILPMKPEGFSEKDLRDINAASYTGTCFVSWSTD